MNIRKITGVVFTAGAVVLTVGCGGGGDSSPEQPAEVASLPAKVETLDRKLAKMTRENKSLERELGKVKGNVGTTPEPDPPDKSTMKTISVESLQSPSGNIACYLGSDHARCEIKEKSWDPGSPPAECRLDWGYGLTVSGTGAGGILCAGDTVKNPDATVLEYGTASQIGPFRCESQESGMTCENTGTGHGFFLSKETYTVS